MDDSRIRAVAKHWCEGLLERLLEVRGRMGRRPGLAAAVALSTVASFGGQAAANDIVPVGPGLNVNGIFYGDPVNVSPADLMAKVHGLGFSWIRLPINITAVMHGDAAKDADIRRRLPEVLAAARKANLPVIVSPMLQPDSGKNLAEIADASGLQRYEGILEFIAADISQGGGRDGLEVFNEPEDCSTAMWDRDQRALYEYLRSKYKTLPIVLTSDCWSGFRTLTKLDASRYSKDPNAYFTFHFYEPNVFVSQDSPWAMDYTRCTSRISFPPNVSERAQILKGCAEKLRDDKTIDSAKKQQITNNLGGVLDEYFRTDWRARIDSTFQQVALWKSRYGVPTDHVLLTEFGAQASEGGRQRADDPSRAAWIRTVVSAARAHQLPWNYWALYGDRALADRGTPLSISEDLSQAIVR